MAYLSEDIANPLLLDDLPDVYRLETNNRVYGGKYTTGEYDEGISNLQAMQLMERDNYILRRIGSAAETGIYGKPGIASLDTNGRLPKAQNTSGVVFTYDAQTLKNKTLKTGDGNSFYLGTASRAIVTDSNNKIIVSDTTAQELDYVHGVTSAIQTQLDDKLASKNITNCIKQIQQDIIVSYATTILTVASGTKVYNALGNSWIISSNVTRDFSNVGSSPNNKWILVFEKNSNNSHVYAASAMWSQPTQPSSGGVWLNTNTNEIKWSNDAVTWGDCSFPIGIVSTDNDRVIQDVQVFNGMGYIGSTIFALPGVKALGPNGLNNDGTLKNLARSITNVTTVTCSSTGSRLLLFSDNALNDVSTEYVYDYVRNLVYNSSTGNVFARALVASYTTTAGVISNFKPKTAFHAVDWNDIMKGSGRERTPALSAATDGGTVKYIVQQGVCYVVVDALKMQATGNAQTICSLPKHKFSTTLVGIPVISSYGDALRGSLYISNSTLGYNCQNIATGYATFSYPVADDWVEG